MNDAGTTASEECDGRDLGGVTCAGLGYVGGTLACNSSCTLDGRGCESCGGDPRVVGCVHPVMPSPPFTLSLATTSTEIDVAWAEGSAGGLHFTRFRPDLTVLSDLACLPGLTARSVALANMPSGWLIATTNEPVGDTLTLVRLDAQGGVTWSSPILHADGSGGFYSFDVPQLLAGTSGGPLLVWDEGNGSAGSAYLQSLDLDGAPSGSALTIANAGYVVGTAVDNGFALAASVPGPTGNAATQLFHLASDGTLTRGALIGAGSPSGLAWSGSDLRLSYEAEAVLEGGAQQAMYVQRATRDGALVGAPQIFESFSTALVTNPLFAVGDDTVVLRYLEGSLASSMILGRWTSQQSLSWPEVTFASAPLLAAPQLGQQGGDAIVAFIDGYYFLSGIFPTTAAARLSLERIRITP
jgi:hypothetical protein